jgi:hypothetical protein
MRALLLTLVLLTASADVSAAYRSEIEKYRSDRVAELTAPNGWLAVQGLFTILERPFSLEPVYETSKHEDLFFVFKDLTSRTQTYEAGRFLHTPLPLNGEVDLDFNRAYNPPCAFTAFATCPLPVKGNQLPVRIPAGELRWKP